MLQGRAALGDAAAGAVAATGAGDATGGSCAAAGTASGDARRIGALKSRCAAVASLSARAAAVRAPRTDLCAKRPSAGAAGAPQDASSSGDGNGGGMGSWAAAGAWRCDNDLALAREPANSGRPRRRHGSGLRSAPPQWPLARCGRPTRCSSSTGRGPLPSPYDNIWIARERKSAAWSSAHELL